MRRRPAFLLPLVAAALLSACGDDDEKKDPSCDVTQNTGCRADQVCEPLQSGGSICADPVIVTGRVFGLADETAVEGAHVVALDVNGAPVSSVAVTDEEGEYELAIPHPRNEDGEPVGMSLTLRADAEGFLTFPSGIRTALPIDTAQSAKEEKRHVLRSALTEIGLIELPAGSGTGSIFGKVELGEDRRGTLVVAEREGRGTSAIADRDGNYRIFNLADGEYSLRAYTRGVNYEEAEATVAEGGDTRVDLLRSEARTATLRGKVEIVDRGRGVGTSIILVPEPLFDETNLRGESPPGLRAPDGGMEPNVTGDFVIEGVPPGRYVVLAAFENDHLVRDPDTSIGGTAIVRQTVEAGADLTLEQSFKVTGSIAFLPPLGPTAVAVSEAPTLSWEDDSSEDGYELKVYDALGNEVWTPADPIPGHSGNNPSIVYEGPLSPGMYYQVKVRSMKRGVPLSTTEDLAGVFYVE